MNPRRLRTETPSEEAREHGINRNAYDMPTLITEMLHGATKTHMAHLKSHSYAAHIALNEFYDALPELADSLAESWQGATETLLNYPEVEVKQITTTEEAIKYLRDLYNLVQRVQDNCMYSEIINNLDLVKSQINSTKYKLIFLK